ncbi:protein phosphatase 2C domain-containing protein [Kallipyga gabonensis]|uniref:protein phosphatase 2C domain-containing protein n=1 Tax=Kallipyga gabonensis TaxID=1686287 RepID=UPI0006B51FAA|nr:protein phosphatase 2C domain-containing protein [Kallipyga gabonensis]
MIRYYSANMPGPYHIKEGIPCQDAYFVRRDKEGVVYAGVADGLGSEYHSDDGARIAVKESCLYCMELYQGGMDFPEVKKIMNNAFVYAYKAVLEEAVEAGNPSNEYDTTLSLVIYDQGKVFYGQSGDSGIVALMSSGEYLALTSQQRDEDGHVFPLCSGPDRWVFGEVLDPVSSIMVMTDGVWEEINPPLLRHQEVTINVALTMRFMDRTERTLKEVKALEKAARCYLKQYPQRLLDDDKTIVVIFDPSHPAKRLGEEYYKMPDWTSLQESIRAKLYADPVLDESGSQGNSALVPQSYWDYYRPE